MAASALCIGMTASSVASANTLTDHAPRVVEAPMSTAPRRTRAQAGGTRFYHSRYCCAVKTNPREKFRRINILWRKDYHCRLAFYVVMICRWTKRAQLLVFLCVSSLVLRTCPTTILSACSSAGDFGLRQERRRKPRAVRHQQWTIAAREQQENHPWKS
jgi:hypothetical protein